MAASKQREKELIKQIKEKDSDSESLTKQLSELQKEVTVRDAEISRIKSEAGIDQKENNIKFLVALKHRPLPEDRLWTLTLFWAGEGTKYCYESAPCISTSKDDLPSEFVISRDYSSKDKSKRIPVGAVKKYFESIEVYKFGDGLAGDLGRGAEVTVSCQEQSQERIICKPI